MRKLLCVDDSSDVLQLRAASMAIAGFAVTICDNPRDGLAKLATQNFDAVVTDFHMPDLNGAEFAGCARANGYTNPIVLCTGSPTLDGQTMPAFDAIVRKGLPPSVLGSIVNDCISRKAVNPVAKGSG